MKKINNRGTTLNTPKSGTDADEDSHPEILRALANSPVYRTFADDFHRTTGLPVSLTPVEAWQLAHHGQPGENSFCALMSQNNPACAACLRTQGKLVELAADSARTVECVHGLCETAVPVRAGGMLVGFLRTGQLFRRRPTSGGFNRVVKRLEKWGARCDRKKLRKAYFATRVVDPRQYRSSVGLLVFLAYHLSLMSNQVLLEQAHAQEPMAEAARKFIEANYAGNITLGQVAKAVHTSTCYFSKKFRRSTGINFNVFVARLRVEKSKALLLNPHYRISEIAYATGFGSPTNFNRVFNRIAGLSATAYRQQLGHWKRANNSNARRAAP
jgi:AraC-like DNA-binding protein/ligand-binding sensor protein